MELITKYGDDLEQSANQQLGDNLEQQRKWNGAAEYLTIFQFAKCHPFSAYTTTMILQSNVWQINYHVENIDFVKSATRTNYKVVHYLVKADKNSEKERTI